MGGGTDNLTGSRVKKAASLRAASSFPIRAAKSSGQPERQPHQADPPSLAPARSNADESPCDWPES